MLAGRIAIALNTNAGKYCLMTSYMPKLIAVLPLPKPARKYSVVHLAYAMSNGFGHLVMTSVMASVMASHHGFAHALETTE